MQVHRQYVQQPTEHNTPLALPAPPHPWTAVKEYRFCPPSWARCKVCCFNMPAPSLRPWRCRMLARRKIVLMLRQWSTHQSHTENITASEHGSESHGHHNVTGSAPVLVATYPPAPLRPLSSLPTHPFVGSVVIYRFFVTAFLHLDFTV